ncbi:MAG: hypothetical protein Q7T03_05750 [Deltaproteobacteria bacterium]|nr:hypothetical protein [Deltaproteobacteria bacterium]
MTIQFDPKAKAVDTLLGEQIAQPKSDVINVDTFAEADPVTVVSEMSLLFSGTNRLRQFQIDNPHEPINVPDLQKDILGKMPILTRSDHFGSIISDYKNLRANLVERRSNYAHALEGFLKPEESIDIYGRMDEIDQALREIQQNLSLAEQWQKDRLKQS